MNVMKNGLVKIFYLLILALVLVAGKAIAQDYGQQQQKERGQTQQYQQQQPKTDFSDEKLEKFATVFSQVQDIQEAYSNEVGQMSDKQEAQKLQEKYTGKMMDVIRGEGLTVQEYNEILQDMNKDQELRQKVQSMMKK